MTGLFTWSAGVSVDGDTYAGTTTLFYPPYVSIGTMYITGAVASYGVYISMPPSGQLYELRLRRRWRLIPPCWRPVPLNRLDA